MGQALSWPPLFSSPEAGRKEWVGESRRYFWALFRESPARTDFREAAVVLVLCSGIERGQPGRKPGI